MRKDTSKKLFVNMNALRLFMVFFQLLFASWHLNPHVTNANRDLKMQN